MVAPELAKSIGIGIGFLSCIGIGIVKRISQVLVPQWLLCWSRVYSVGPLQLAGHFDVLDGSNGSCGQGNGGWTNQVNFWAIFFQMENLMGNWCKILAKLC